MKAEHWGKLASSKNEQEEAPKHSWPKSVTQLYKITINKYSEENSCKVYTRAQKRWLTLLVGRGKKGKDKAACKDASELVLRDEQEKACLDRGNIQNL